ncbi:hypothetical protein NQ317_018579 [Molorchus minor]|uniref:Uncharacterized protein n=1 Tax=Molorchus minor TaxID=1323400 RepID=A0ABQ9JYU1_9CUCU|nr:hypothetical protein NQ317_018579 [Molorchus minor]
MLLCIRWITKLDRKLLDFWFGLFLYCDCVDEIKMLGWCALVGCFLYCYIDDVSLLVIKGGNFTVIPSKKCFTNNTVALGWILKCAYFDYERYNLNLN